MYLVQRLPDNISSLQTGERAEHSLRNKRCLPEDSQKYSKVQHRTPEPVARVVAGRLRQVTPEQDDGEAEEEL